MSDIDFLIVPTVGELEIAGHYHYYVRFDRAAVPMRRQLGRWKYLEILRDVGAGEDADDGRKEDAEDAGKVPFLSVAEAVAGAPVLAEQIDCRAPTSQ